MVYAEIKQFRERILYIWNVVVSVERPWRITFLTDLIDWNLYVNGAAMHASPSSSIASAPPSAAYFFFTSSICSI